MAKRVAKTKPAQLELPTPAVLELKRDSQHVKMNGAVVGRVELVDGFWTFTAFKFTKVVMHNALLPELLKHVRAYLTNPPGDGTLRGQIEGDRQ